MHEKPYRSVVKTISWRTVGTLDTIIVSYFVTGNLVMAASIGSIEVITKMILYYFHERAWNKLKFGTSKTNRKRLSNLRYFMSIEIVKNIEEKILSLNTTDLIKYILENYKNVALSSSLGAEDQVLTDMIFKVNKNSRVFTLDTGRLHSETYKVLDATNLKYGVKIEVFFPKFEDVENLYKTQGVNGHFESIDKRKNCCNIRKIEPLKRALKNVDIWITGLEHLKVLQEKLCQ
jgi:uncharacterized membrane protein